MGSATVFAALKEALRDRYCRSITDAWKRAADVWHIKQLPQQSTDDFLTALQQSTQKLNVSAEQTFLEALKGLLFSIRQHLIEHDPITIKDMRKW